MGRLSDYVNAIKFMEKYKIDPDYVLINRDPFYLNLKHWDINGEFDELDEEEIPVKINLVDGCFVIRSYATNSNLKSLKNFPTYVRGKFELEYLKHIVNLEGGPEYVGDDFYVKLYNLKSLKGCPKFVRNNFELSTPSLESIDDFPTTIGEGIAIHSGKIKDFGCAYRCGIVNMIHIGGLKNLESFEGLPDARAIYIHPGCDVSRIKDFKPLKDIKIFYMASNGQTNNLEEYESYIREQSAQYQAQVQTKSEIPLSF